MKDHYVKIEDRAQLDKLIETFDGLGWKASKPGLTAYASDKNQYPIYVKHGDDYDWIENHEETEKQWRLDFLIEFHELFNHSRKMYVKMHPEEVPGYEGWNLWMGPQINPSGGANVRVSDLVRHFEGRMLEMSGMPITVIQHIDREESMATMCKINYIKPIQIRTKSSYCDVGEITGKGNNYDEWFWEFGIDVQENVVHEDRDTYIRFMFMRQDYGHADAFGFNVSAFRNNNYMYYTNLI